jgi:hypothetical protein
MCATNADAGADAAPAEVQADSRQDFDGAAKSKAHLDYAASAMAALSKSSDNGALDAANPAVAPAIIAGMAFSPAGAVGLVGVRPVVRTGLVSLGAGRVVTPEHRYATSDCHRPATVSQRLSRVAHCQTRSAPGSQFEAHVERLRREPIDGCFHPLGVNALKNINFMIS